MPSALGLEEHLGRYYGVDSLRNAVSKLKLMQKTNQVSIKRIKEANSTSSQRLAELQNDVEQTARHVEEAIEKHKAVMDRLDRARERERTWEIKQRQDDHSAWVEAVERLAVRVSADLGRPVSIGNVESVLNERLADLDQQIGPPVSGSLSTWPRRKTLTANEERLSTAHEDCQSAGDHLTTRRSPWRTGPTLRRCLPSAVQSWNSGLPKPIYSRSANALGPPRLVATDPATGGAATARRRCRQSADLRCAALCNSRGCAQRPRGGSRGPHPGDKGTYEAHAADEAMHELESLFRQEARLRVAVEATEATLNC